MDDLRDCVSRKAVTMYTFTFASLSKTVDWTTHHLPSDPDQFLVCIDAPTLLRSIGNEFSTSQDMNEALYQNKKAGISSSPLTLHSRFSTVLLEILGDNVTVEAEEYVLLLLCAKTYKYWFCNDYGVMTGANPHILEGIANQ
jgi:hypothetical protein